MLPMKAETKYEIKFHTTDQITVSFLRGAVLIFKEILQAGESVSAIVLGCSTFWKLQRNPEPSSGLAYSTCTNTV